MARGTGLTVKVRITGVRATLAAFRELPDDANAELRTRSKALAETLAVQVRGAAVADGPQSAMLAPTVKAGRDRVPVITAGGSRKVGRNRKPAGALLFASEFGMSGQSGWYNRPPYRGSSGRQWHAHAGRGSYWFFRTVEDNSARIDREWNAAADAIVRAWGRGG